MADETDEHQPPRMSCPSCGSSDVECHENTVRHVHLCNTCGHKDIYRGGHR